MLTRFYGSRRSFREGLLIWPFALFASLSFTLPYFLCSYFLGPEFPSILGASIVLLIVIFAVRKGWFAPRDTWDFSPRQQWNSAWSGLIHPGEKMMRSEMTIGRAWSPYALVAVLLLVSRLPALGLQQRLAGVQLAPTNILGTGIGQQIQPFYLPGFVFIVVCLLTYGLHRMSWSQIRE